MAPKEWCVLAEVIEKNNFPSDAIQHAIWSISDDIPLSSVTAEDPSKVMLLRNTVASLKKIEVPWYTVIYKKDTASLFTGMPQHVKGEVPYYLSTNAMITIVIREKGGRMKASLKSDLPADKGDQLFLLDMSVLGWKKGEYDILIYEDGSRLNHRKSFTL
jgi:hypothetical protein